MKEIRTFFLQKESFNMKITGNLLVDGHSINELIELFQSKEETRDIYINSALVYPDFKMIVKALEYYKEYHKSGLGTDRLNKGLEMQFFVPRLFVDLDGTLAKFIPQKSTEPLYEKNYFRNLPPQQNVVDAVKKIVLDESNGIEVFILTAYLVDSQWAYQEKMAWIDEFIPEIDIRHRIFTPCGENKKDYIVGFNEEKDVLLDDYTQNLLKWTPGRAIKLLNGINHSKGTWKGDMVSADWSSDELAMSIVNIVKDKQGICETTNKMMNLELKHNLFSEKNDAILAY